jgi:K(+)-stimulated pyrophosphate-energized sodium pump
MVEIAGYIAEGARAFLRREYRVLIIFVLAVAALLAVANYEPGAVVGDDRRLVRHGRAVLGAGRVHRDVRRDQGQRPHDATPPDGLGPALNVAFSGGLVMGLSVVGLGVLGSACCSSCTAIIGGTSRR